jgi:hypothetical protein
MSIDTHINMMAKILASAGKYNSRILAVDYELGLNIDTDFLIVYTLLTTLFCDEKLPPFLSLTQLMRQ